MPSSRTRNKVLAFASMAGVTLAASGAHADFFDAIGRIFGGEPSPAPQVQTYSPDATFEDRGSGLEVVVRPRRAAPPRQVVRKPAPKEVATASMDPVKNPDWYLDDPTLRRGDILVLKGEVLVFEGTGTGRHRREEFASLAESKLPAADKQKLREMAGLQVPAVTAPPQQIARSKSGRVMASMSQD